MRQTKKHNAIIFFHAVAMLAVAGCSPAPTAEDQGRAVGAKIDKSIDKTDKVGDAVIQHPIRARILIAQKT